MKYNIFDWAFREGSLDCKRLSIAVRFYDCKETEKNIENVIPFHNKATGDTFQLFHINKLRFGHYIVYL